MPLSKPFFVWCYRSICTIVASVLLDSALLAQTPSAASSTNPNASGLTVGTSPVQAPSAPPAGGAEAKPMPAESRADGARPAPNVEDGVSFGSGRLEEIVSAIEHRIRDWPLGGSWQMPNVVFGGGSAGLQVTGPITLRGVTPLQVLTLVAAAAGCALEPIQAITEEERSQYAKGQVIGYRFVLEATHSGRTTAERDADQRETKPVLSPDATPAALDLSYQQFDQTPHSGWRLLAQDEKRFREAAALIETYLSHARLDPSEQINLHFHAAQCLAFAGDEKSLPEALGHLKQARYSPEPPGLPLRWNDYVSATEAFLKGDLDALKAARERIANGPKLDGVPANLDVADRLIAGLGRPYREAYGAEPSH